MNRTASTDHLPAATPTADTVRTGETTVKLVFLATLGLVCLKTFFPILALAHTGWPEALLVLAATTAVLFFTSRLLPFQNVMLAAVIIGLAGSTAQSLETLTAWPFGRCEYTDAAGPRCFKIIPWAIPLMWIVVILASRGVAQSILRPWRKTPAYGLWLIGLTALMSLAFDLGLEPFATQARHYWSWPSPEFSPGWHGTPLPHFAVRLLVSVFISVLALPALIRKKPGEPTPEYHFVAVWILLNLLFAGAALAARLWLAAGFSLLIVPLVAAAVRRGRNGLSGR